MDIFIKNKFLLRIVIVLIILNLFSVGFVWWQRKPPPHDKHPPQQDKENIITTLKDKLNLSDEQEKETQ